MFKMIYEESNFGEDNLLSLEEFLEAPLVKTDDIINAWNLWSVMQAAGMSELLDIDVPTDMTDFAAGQVEWIARHDASRRRWRWARRSARCPRPTSWQSWFASRC